MMASIAAGVNADDQQENTDFTIIRSLRRQRFFRDLANPLEDFPHDDDVKLRFRFYRATIYEILDEIDAAIRHPTNNSRALPPLIQLLVALRFYACGAYYHAIGDHVHVNKSTACRCITRVSLALRALTPRVIVFPNRQKQAENKVKFGRMAGFPGIIGVVDGILIETKRPSKNVADFICRKQYPAINVQVCCGPNDEIIHAVVKYPGCVNDARIWDESSLKRMMEVPEMEGYLLGDSGYPCQSSLLTPYPNPTTPSEKRFNKGFVKTRVRIEMLFGIYRNRFGCCNIPLRLSTPSRCCMIIQTCMVLHNLAINKRDLYDPLLPGEEGFQREIAAIRQARSLAPAPTSATVDDMELDEAMDHDVADDSNEEPEGRLTMNGRELRKYVTDTFF